MSTLSTLQSNVCGTLGLNNVTAANGGDQDRVTGWLNDAVLDLLLRTHCYVTTATTTLTANQSDYTLDTTILAVDEIYVTSGGQGTRLLPRPARQVIDLRLNSAASSPSQFYALLGANLLTLWPTPSGSDTLTLYYVPRPTAMSSSGNDPSNTTYGGVPAEYHYGLELYAMWKGGAYKKDQASAQGERYRLEYEGQDATGGYIRKVRMEQSRKAGRPLGYFVPRLPADYVVAHDPSADYRQDGY